MGDMSHHGIQGAETRTSLDGSITDALSKLDARGRKRQAVASTQRPITDDMPVNLQVHLAKMGAPDHRTTTPDEGLLARSDKRGSISQRSSEGGEGEDKGDDAE